MKEKEPDTDKKKMCYSAESLLGLQPRPDQSHIERELRQLHSLQWNVFFYSNGGSWSLSKVPGSSSKHMQRHRDAAEQTVCDALLKG